MSGEKSQSCRSSRPHQERHEILSRVDDRPALDQQIIRIRTLSRMSKWWPLFSPKSTDASRLDPTINLENGGASS